MVTRKCGGDERAAAAGRLGGGTTGRPKISPRVTGTVGTRLTADASVELPVRIRTTETMVVPDYRIRAAVNWRF